MNKECVYEYSIKERMLYELIREHESMKRTDIQKELGLKKSQTINIINKLRDFNLVVQVGNGRETKYMIKPL